MTGTGPGPGTPPPPGSPGRGQSPTPRERTAFRIAVAGIFFGILAVIGSVGTGDRLAAVLAVLLTGGCALMAQHISRNGL